VSRKFVPGVTPRRPPARPDHAMMTTRCTGTAGGAGRRSGEGGDRPPARTPPLPHREPAPAGIDRRAFGSRSPTRSKSTDILRTTSADIWRPSIGTDSCSDPARRPQSSGRATVSIQARDMKRPRTPDLRSGAVPDRRGSERAATSTQPRRRPLRRRLSRHPRRRRRHLLVVIVVRIGVYIRLR
jgi:hypothetical protein